MFGAPNRTPYDLNFSIMGIPVRVHPLFWLVAAILGFRAGDPAAILIWVGVMFFSILVHELGHAFAMRYFRHNPSIVLYGGGGLAMYESMDSPWSSFGTNYGGRDSPWTKILIAAAGPAAGFALAAIVILYLVVAILSDGGGTISWDSFVAFLDSTNPLLTTFIWSMLFINILWGLINLLPIYPLDGGQIAREIAQVVSPYDGVRVSLWISLVTAACVGVLGFQFLGSLFIAIMFGYFAVMNWQLLQGPGGFGGGGGYGGGGRPW